MQLLRQNVSILIQLLGTANAMDINPDFYVTSSALASRYQGSLA